MKIRKDFAISILVLLFCAVISKYISKLPYLNIVGHLVIALVIGMILQSTRIKPIAKISSPFVSNKFLRLGIILMGFKLNLIILGTKGRATLPLAFLVVVFTLIIIYLIARKLNVDKKLALITACGCSICGAAAVLALSEIVGNDKDEEIISIATVAILGTFFTIALVLLRPFLALNEFQYGALSGLSLHEIAHAIAAGGSYTKASLQIATIAKLSRVLMLVPLSIFLSLIKKDNKFSVSIPWFMLGFLLSSALGTYIPFFAKYSSILEMIAFYLLAMAMVALGVNVNFSAIKKKGKKVLLAAFLGSVSLVIFSMIIVKIFF